MTSESWHEGAAVSTMTRSITSTMSPTEVFHLSARLARRLLQARRATILLLDDSAALVPEVSVAHDADDELLARFHDMAPIPLAEMPGAWELLLAGEVVVIPRAAASPIVPRAWQHAFGVQALAIAPLVLESVPCGALIVEADHPDVLATPSLIRAMGSIAAMTAMAVGDARRRRRDSERLVDLTVTHDALQHLGRATSIQEVAQVGLDALLRLASGEGGAVVVQASSGAVAVLAGRQPGEYLHDLPRLQAFVTATRIGWADSGTESRLLVVPLPHRDAQGGVCLVSLPPGEELPPERLLVVRLLADGLARELRRAASDEARQLMGSCSAALSPAWCGELGEARDARPLDLTGIRARLSIELRRHAGLELVDVALVDAELCQAWRLRRATSLCAKQLRAWRRESACAGPVVEDDLWLVPLVAASDVFGCARFRAVEAGRFGCDKVSLTTHIAAQLTQLLIVERARLADLAADAAVTELATWRAELRTAAGSLSHEGGDHLLAGLLRAASQDQAHREPFYVGVGQVTRAGVPTGVRVRTRIGAGARRLAPTTEALLWRVSDELVPVLSERGRATRLDVELGVDRGHVVLTMCDDGLPLAHRCGAATGLFRTLRRLADLCEQAGGTLVVQNALPLGVRVAARLPLEARPRPGAGPPRQRSRPPRSATTTVPHPPHIQETS